MHIRKVALVIVVSSILLIICGISLSFFKNEQHSKDNSQEVVTKKRESLIYNQDYMKYHSSVEDLLVLVDNVMYNSYPISDFQSISSKKKTELLINIVFTHSNFKVLKSNLELKKQEVFSDDISLIYDDFETNNYKFAYDKTTEEYTILEVVSANFNVESHIIDEYFLDDGTWVITKGIYFVESTYLPDIYPQRIFASSQDAKKLKNEIYTVNNAEESLSVDKNYKKVKDLIKTYTYTLKKVDDVYKIQSII